MKYARYILDTGDTWLLRRPYPRHSFAGLTAAQADRIVACLDRNATPAMRQAMDRTDLAVSRLFFLERFLDRFGSVFVNLKTMEVK